MIACDTMEFARDTLYQFLWETYLIDFGTHTRKQIRSITLEEKTEFNKHLNLFNLFIVRKARDPGFFQFIMEEISKDPACLHEMRYYAETLFYKYIYRIDDEIFRLKPATTGSSEGTGSRAGQISAVNGEKDYGNLRVRDEILSYLNQRLAWARVKKDYEEISTVRQLIKEFTTGKVLGCIEYEDNLIYEELPSSNGWVLSSRKYLLENILFSGNYFTSTSDIDALLVDFVAPTEVFENIVLDIVELYSGMRYEKFYDAIMQHTRFVQDLLSIASVIWFNKMTEPEKLRILNKEYAFAITEERLNQYFSSNEDPSPLIDYGNKLIDNYYYSEASYLLGLLFERLDNPYYMYLCAYNLGIAYRDGGRLDYAVTSFRHAADYLNQLEDDDFYKAFLLSLSLGEVCHLSGKISEANIIFKKLDDLLKGLTDSASIIFLSYDVAKSYRKIGEFEKEYDTLLKIIRLSDVSGVALNPDRTNYCLDRIYELDTNRLPLGGFLHEPLRKIDTDEKVNNYLKRALRAKNSFQFAKALDILGESLRFCDCSWPGYLPFIFSSIFSLYPCSSHPEILKPIIKHGATHIDSPLASATYGLCLIEENQLVEGVLNLEKAFYACVVKNSDYNWLIYLIIGELIRTDSRQHMFPVFSSLEEKLSKVDPEAAFFNKIGTIFYENGLFEEAIFYFEKGLEKYTDPVAMSKLYNNLGSVFQSMDDIRCLNYFQKAIDACSNLTMPYYNIALFYGQKLDFKIALKYLDEARKLDPTNSRITDLTALYEMLSTDVINLESITDPDVKKAITSAEQLLLKTYKHIDDPDNFDFSMAMIDYGKGLELMLHYHISLPLRARILKIYNGEISPHYFSGYQTDKKRIYGLPNSLKNILGQDVRTISLGQWAHISDSINKKLSNPVVRKTKDIIDRDYSAKLPVIINICDKIYDFRNDSAHNQTMKRDDVLTIRKDLVYQLNRAIEQIYGNKI